MPAPLSSNRPSRSSIVFNMKRGLPAWKPPLRVEKVTAVTFRERLLHFSLSAKADSEKCKEWFRLRPKPPRPRGKATRYDYSRRDCGPSDTSHGTFLTVCVDFLAGSPRLACQSAPVQLNCAFPGRHCGSSPAGSSRRPFSAIHPQIPQCGDIYRARLPASHGSAAP